MKKILMAILLLQTPLAAMATNYINVSVGSISRDTELDGVFSTAFTSQRFIDEDTDSGFLLGLGASRITESLYLTGNLYIPSSDNDDDYLLDISPHYRLNNHLYAGVVIGLQRLEDGDPVAASSIGATSSSIDLSGVTAGLSLGYLSSNQRLDLNLKLRFVNGDEDSLTGSYLGVNYDVQVEVTQVFQLTVGYNFN